MSDFGLEHNDPIDAFPAVAVTPNVGVRPGGGGGSASGSSVSELLMKPGAWSVTLKEETPAEILRAIDWTVTAVAGFGHIYIFNTRVRPEEFTDANLKSIATYAGILLEAPTARSIGGPGMIAWLGDADDKGAILETAVTQSAATLQTWVNALRPASLSAGTSLNSGSYTGTFQWITPRQALDAVCAALGYEYRVNPDGTLDANTAATLFGSTPTGFVTRRTEGREDYLGILATQLEQARDLIDYTTKVRAIAKTGLGTASGAATPYKDINGNSVVMTRVIETPEAEDANAAATALINKFSATRKGVRLSSSTFAIPSTIEVGASVYVYDPRSGLVDTANQVHFGGELLFPVSLRVYGYTWPIREGMGVAFRDGNGVWTDLTPWVEWGDGDTTIDVGGYARTLDGDPSYTGSGVVAPAVEEGRWTSYSPGWSGTVGNGTLTGRYRRIGTTVFYRFRLTWGSTTSHAAATQYCGVPIPPVDLSQEEPAGLALCHNVGVTRHPGIGLWSPGGNGVFVSDCSTTQVVTNTVPFTWGSGDQLFVAGEYEAAIT